MNFELVRRLILYLVDQLNDLGGAVSKIRIVKLLYILDLEHYRLNGETLTKLDWIYFHYGPFAFAIDTVIKQSGLDMGEESFETVAGYKGFTYRSYSPQNIDGLVDTAVRLRADRIIRHWALLDTRDLLDYVYNDTEPMQNVIYLQQLDFSTIRQDIRVFRRSRNLKLSSQKSAFIQNMLQQRKEQRDMSEITPPRYDRVFDEAMMTFDGEDKANFQTATNLTISSEAINSLREKNE